MKHLKFFHTLSSGYALTRAARSLFSAPCRAPGVPRVLSWTASLLLFGYYTLFVPKSFYIDLLSRTKSEEYNNILKSLENLKALDGLKAHTPLIIHSHCPVRESYALLNLNHRSLYIFEIQKQGPNPFMKIQSIEDIGHYKTSCLENYWVGVVEYHNLLINKANSILDEFLGSTQVNATALGDMQKFLNLKTKIDSHLNIQHSGLVLRDGVELDFIHDIELQVSRKFLQNFLIEMEKCQLSEHINTHSFGENDSVIKTRKAKI